ncbi:MAG: recombination protein RecR [Pelagibacteraceae bacterium]|nr:recombination protein RecR [Pelagibacteraceae bacterium]
MAQDELQKLINLIARLPGLGQKSAQRIALYLIKNRSDLMNPIAESIKLTSSQIKKCDLCGILDTKLPCKICSSSSRDPSIICIVEDMADVWAFERSGFFKGRYHVLGGLLSAAKGFSEKDLNLKKINDRLQNNKIKEIVLALSATIEGQTTALVIKDFFDSDKVKITQLAYGVPVGSEIHYLDDNTLGAALESRKNL